MVQYARALIYFLLIDFFLAIFFNAFLKTKMDYIFIYLFESPKHSLTLSIIYFVISYLPVILINGFLIWFISYLLEIEGRWRWAIFSLHLLLFCVLDGATVYVINNPAFWTTRATIEQNVFIVGVNFIALFALLVKQKPLFVIERVNQESEEHSEEHSEEKTEESK